MEIKGLSADNIKLISKLKNEDSKVTDFRLKSYEYFKKLDMPKFGPELDINFDDVLYYSSSSDKINNNWDNVDKNVRNELNSLGVIDSECYLDGVGVQYQSEVIYHNMIKELEEKNVIFTSIEDAMKRYPELVFKYFSKIVSPNENKFVALNGACFSGGSFIYIPKNTHLNRPLQSYFRINKRSLGQFERTLIIVDDNSELHYMEGCTARSYSDSNLHAAVVEIYVGKNSKCRYTTIQNWANNVYNLVTKRAVVESNGCMEWIDGNVGSKKNMKYPCCVLKGDYAKGLCISIGVSKNGQYQDTGAKMIHIGKNTTSKIVAKSIAMRGGRSDYRGKVEIKKSASNSVALVKCDTLILDKDSISNTYPVDICSNTTSSLEHEATVSKISMEKLFYLMSRGLEKEEAINLILLGFTDEFKQELPMEYAVELNQLLKY